ncbi:MAG: hypothetical protein WCS96_02100 [Victivallales bacterium]
MRKFAALIIGVAALTVVCGCASTHVSQWSSPLDVKLEANITPLLEIGDEIKGTATITRILFFSSGATEFADGVEYTAAGSGSLGYSLFGNAVAEGKAAAAYDACNKAGADVIIAPRYTVETKDYVVYAKTIINVKGYKGVFKGLKK